MKQLADVKQFNSMNFDQLLAIKANVEAVIKGRIEEERRRLTASLERLNSMSPNGSAIGHSKNHASRGKRRKLAIKYRNPANPKQAWAGRGLRPRWLVAELKGGKRKLSDFEVKA
jgi:DNA-binding protein H-NS